MNNTETNVRDKVLKQARQFYKSEPGSDIDKQIVKLVNQLYKGEIDTIELVISETGEKKLQGKSNNNR